MAYYTDYYTNYFDVGEGAVAAEVARQVGGLAPTKEEWERYLRKINEYQIERMARKVADRENLRALIMDGISPRPVVKVPGRAPLTKAAPQKPTQLEIIRKPVRQLSINILDVEPELRRQLAQKIVAIRKRAKKIRRKKRDEEALMLLWQ